ncbi:hypothetical protein [Iodidimonas sp. SYSU 1G8]|uniref:hypothetical protein n=1 Tax=Iodidimonas sp. SYSU 1G8 TaxID=3133967 RepID=UPI0031FE682E
MSKKQPWMDHFRIQSITELDFVIGEELGIPVGMPRKSDPAFRRRIAAAAVSYQLLLKSIDYASKKYIPEDLYEEDKNYLGDLISDYLKESAEILQIELKNFHGAGDETFGVIGTEITLFKIPDTFDVARMLANRGLLIEVLPILRLCLEMGAWAKTAFITTDEHKVVALKANNCIQKLKLIYPPIGKIYGYLSNFTHWGYIVHKEFLLFEDEKAAVLHASVTYRAQSLALCLLVLDVLLEVIRDIYGENSSDLIRKIQGSSDEVASRNTRALIASMVELCEIDELRRIQLFFK